MHLPSLVQTGTYTKHVVSVLGLGGYVIVLLVSIFLRLGCHLYPISGLELKICVSSSVFWIIFQLLFTRDPIWRFLGLNWVTITGASVVGLGTVSRSSSCEYFLALK